MIRTEALDQPLLVCWGVGPVLRLFTRDGMVVRRRALQTGATAKCSESIKRCPRDPPEQLMMLMP